MLGNKMHDCDDDDSSTHPVEGIVFFAHDKEMLKSSRFFSPMVNANSYQAVITGKAKRQPNVWAFDCNLSSVKLGRPTAHPRGFAAEPFSIWDSYSKAGKFNAVPVLALDPYTNQKVAQKCNDFKDVEIIIDNLQMPSPTLQLSLQESSVAELQARVRFLEAQLRADLPYLRLYKFGGVSLLVAVISLIAWVATGIGVPLHPVFAATVLPVAIGVMIMAFYLRREIRSSDL